jgi:hypothetical protein
MPKGHNSMKAVSMANADVKKKYSNFFAPKMQILVDQNDIFLNRNILPVSIIVEEGVLGLSLR